MFHALVPGASLNTSALISSTKDPKKAYSVQYDDTFLQYDNTWRLDSMTIHNPL